MNKRVAELLNEQMSKELYSAYLYLGMANYYRGEGLDGFENWFLIQAREEQDHGLMIRSYLLDHDEKIQLLTIDSPEDNYANLKAPLLKLIEHERWVTASIDTIYSAAAEAKDYRTMEFLGWFIKEQGEEEKNGGDLLKKYQLFGDDPKSLYQLDQEMKARVYSAPAQQA